MSPVIYQWINVILLFSFLGFVLKKKLTVYFSEQRKALDHEIKTAGAEHHRIETEYQDLQKSWAGISQKISELKERSLKEIEMETKRIEKEAERVIQKMAVDGDARLKNEAERTRKNLEREVFESALALAKESLQKSSTADNQEWIAQIVQPETSAGKKNYAS